jgi:hypothetical protein
MRLTVTLAVLGFLSLAAVATEPQKPVYQVPEPKGWGKETIDLPPKFAPDMAWKGVEDLRFAPGMFKADSPDFFSYALLFWLPDDQKIDPKTMEKELLAYYRGLAKAVLEGKKQKVDASEFTLSIKDAKGKAGKRASGETYTAYVAELKWVEPFATGKAQTLRFEIHTWHSEKHKRNCVFICASPQPETAEVWKKLREIRDGTTTP